MAIGNIHKKGAFGSPAAIVGGIKGNKKPVRGGYNPYSPPKKPGGG